MIETRVTIQGLERLHEALMKAPELTINEISNAVERSAFIIQSMAVKEAPVNKQAGGGNLRQNIRAKMLTKTKAQIESRAPYSIFVEEGTRPHEIKTKNRLVLANKRTGEIFGKHVHHPGTRPNPYMRRALEKSISTVNELFKTAMQNVFNSLK